MHNLFPNKSWTEELDDASEGGTDYTAPGALKGRNYIVPLITLPEYSGDFLDKLRAPLQGKPLEAADNENLWDFSMPSEWLKHQEKPSPRILVDDFYEMGRPGDKDQAGDQPGTGYGDLQEYWDRAWDGEAPEVSEDLIERLDNPFTEMNCDRNFTANKVACNFFRRFACLANEDVRVVAKAVPQSRRPSAGTVVARHLVERFPVDAFLDVRRVKYAKFLEDLKRSTITTKEKGTRSPEVAGVRVVLKKKEPMLGRWTFTTGAEGHTYDTIFQFIPRGREEDLNKLHVRVSCTCPSWLFWGAQYNAYMGDYLYGKIRPMLKAPRVRDPEHKFLVCKHIIACLPWVSHLKIERGMPEDVRKRLVTRPKTVLEKGELPAVLRIPPDLKNFANQPEIRKVVNTWEHLTDQDREKFIQGLDSPGQVAFMAHRFPQTAAEPAIEKLKEMAAEGKLPSFRNWAKRLLKFWLG